MIGKNGLLYSAGSASAALANAAFSTYVMFYYVDVLKMPAALIGTGMMFYGLWNAVNDPLLGQISDGTRTRWGRRVPYILFGSVPLALAFILVWTPPLKWVGGNQVYLFTYFMIAILLFDTLYTLVILNWTALFPEMFRSQEERTKVSAQREIYGILGNVLGIALPPVMYAAVGWPAMGAVFSLVILIFLGVSLLGSREDPVAGRGKGLGMVASLKATFTNYSFLMYVLASLFIQFTFVMLQAGLPFYTKYALGISSQETTYMFGMAFLVALVLVRPWSMAANKIGSRNAMMLSGMIYGLALIPLWFARDFLGGIISTGLLGIGLAGLLVLINVLLSDVIDEDELRTGARREGMYFGVNGFCIRLGISMQAVITGQVLARTGYDAHLAVQPPGAVMGIKSLVTVVPMLSLLLALFFLYKYPLHGERLTKVRENMRSVTEVRRKNIEEECRRLAQEEDFSSRTGYGLD